MKIVSLKLIFADDMWVDKIRIFQMLPISIDVAESLTIRFSSSMDEAILGLILKSCDGILEGFPRAPKAHSNSCADESEKSL